MSTSEKLKDYFQREGSGGRSFAQDDALLESGVLDSLAIVKLLAYIENEFGVQIQDADFDPDNFESIRAISTLVDTLSG